MPQTKIEIFKIGISQSSNFDLEKNVLNQINEFLSDDNKIYINHSTSILTEDIDEYGVAKTINKFLVVSIVYKDLNETPFNLKNTSKKVRNIVKTEIEKGATLPEPTIETELEKKIKSLNSNKAKTTKTTILIPNT